MTNKLTDILLSQENTDITESPTITMLEKILFPTGSDEFFNACYSISYNYIDSYSVKANIYCFLAAMSDEDLNDFLATFQKDN